MIFALLAREQVFWLGVVTLAQCPRSQPPVCQCAKPEVETAFEAKERARRFHEGEDNSLTPGTLIPRLDVRNGFCHANDGKYLTVRQRHLDTLFFDVAAQPIERNTGEG